jgi:Protein of unknown function (DUF1236)
MRRATINAPITAALVLMLSCISSIVPAQTPAQTLPQAPAAISPKLNLTLEQRHVIKEIIKDMKIEPTAVEVRAAVGEQVPQGINLQPMPGDVAQKVPQVKTHRFFVAGGEIVIVDPKDNVAAEVIKLGAD